MQLVKGHDDIRGDAVMQQVFSLVNVLLRRDPSTRQRGLCMRTYRVVPIAPTALDPDLSGSNVARASLNFVYSNSKDDKTNTRRDLPIRARWTTTT